MLNLVSLSTQSLASCVNYFVWNCLTCFSNTKIGSVTSFSILFNFQGPVRLSLSGWRLDYFTTDVIFCQALFSEAFRFFRTCGSFFQRIHIGSFALLLPLSEVILSGGPWRSSIIPYPQPSVNTFLHLFWVFSIFRKRSASGQVLNPSEMATAISSPLYQGGEPLQFPGQCYII